MADNGILGRIFSAIDSTKRRAAGNVKGAVADPAMWVETLGNDLAEILKKGTSGDVNSFLENIGGIGAISKVERPYANVPDSLMGFRNPSRGPNKAYEETKFKHEIDVRVTFPEDGMTFVDGMKGLNEAHALERARRNWPGAEIDILTPQEAKLEDLMNSIMEQLK